MPPAPYKRTCRWGYLHEALEVEVQHKVELLFTPVINLDAHAAFLRQIAESDPQALHVVIMDQAGFHMREKNPHIPSSVRLVPLPPYCPDLNPAEWFDRVVKVPHGQTDLRKPHKPRRPHHRSPPLERPRQGRRIDSRMDAGGSKRYRQNQKCSCWVTLAMPACFTKSK